MTREQYIESIRGSRFYMSHTGRVHERPTCGANSAIGFSKISEAEAERIRTEHPERFCRRCTSPRKA